MRGETTRTWRPHYLRTQGRIQTKKPARMRCHVPVSPPKATPQEPSTSPHPATPPRAPLIPNRRSCRPHNRPNRLIEEITLSLTFQSHAPWQGIRATLLILSTITLSMLQSMLHCFIGTNVLTITLSLVSLVVLYCSSSPHNAVHSSSSWGGTITLLIFLPRWCQWWYKKWSFLYNQ